MSTRRGVTAIVLAGALAASTPGFAATPGGGDEWQPAQAAKPLVSLGTHAVNGVITFVDTSTLVIIRSGKRPTEMTFSLSATTRRQGPLRAGSTVSIRYLTDRGLLVATGVYAHEQRRSG